MPKAVVTDGYTLDEHIPLYLRDMFYKSSYPEYTYATTNGYDPYGFSTEGLVLYLPLWALKDSPFKSVDAYGHTCTPSGTTIYWTPPGWSFGGANEKGTIPNHASLNFGTGECSFEYWGKCDALNVGGAHNHILGKLLSGTTYDGYSMGLDDDGYAKFQWRSGTVNYESLGNVDLTGVWHHHVGFRNAVGIYNYINGVLVGSNLNAGVQGDVDNAELLTIAQERSGATAENWDGLIGEIRIYNRALSTGEITHNYNCTKFRY